MREYKASRVHMHFSPSSRRGTKRQVPEWMNCPTRWEPQPSQQILQAVAAATQGFAGADLQALCAGAVMAAVHRTAPSLLHKLEQQAMSSQADPSAAQPSEAPDAPAPMTAGQGQIQDAQADVSNTHEESELPRTRASAPQHAAAECAAGPTDTGDEMAEAGSSGRDMSDSGQGQPGDSREQMQLQQEALQPHVAGSRAGVCDAEVHANANAVPVAAAGSIEREAVLAGVRVRASDWREALAAAPEPCSRRQGLAALAADSAGPMPALLAPALLPGLAAALRVLHASGLPLSNAAASAAATAELTLAQSTGACNQPHEEVSAGQEDVWTELRTELVRAGALDATENDVASGVCAFLHAL